MALPLNDLVPLYFENDPLQLGLHPSLSNLSWLFDGGHALPIVNVGPLRYPVNKSDAESDNELLPLHLYSHSHQTAVVQTQTTDSIGDQGWGSLGADILGGVQGPQDLSPVYDMASQSIWGNSRPLSATRISSKLPNDHNFSSASRELYDTLRSPECTEGNLFQEYYSELSYEAEEKYNTFASVMADSNDYGFEKNWIASQLRNAFIIIKAQETLGQTTQYFSLMQGEYDTHNDQLNQQRINLKELADALSVFYTRLQEEGLMDAVTTFTFSEFGRTLIPNGDGTDHGWGSCSMVIGGDVRGQQILGQWPDMTENSADLLNRGRVIPTLSIEQVHASLLQWLGVIEQGVDELFPALVNFPQKSLPLFESCDLSGPTTYQAPALQAYATAEAPSGKRKAEHAIDGDLNSRWAASGKGVQLTVDLVGTHNVIALKVAHNKGDTLRHFFSIEASQDGSNFFPILDHFSPGNTSELYEIPLGSVQANSIRFVCYGNTSTNWNNFKEMRCGRRVSYRGITPFSKGKRRIFL